MKTSPFSIASLPIGSMTHYARAKRARRATIAATVALCVTFAGLPARAIGPEAPVDFDDVYVGRGYLVFVLEPKLVTDLELVRAVYRDGEGLSRTPVKWRELRMFEYTTPVTGPGHFQYRDPSDRDRKEAATAEAPAQPMPLESVKPAPLPELARPGTPIVVKDERPRRVGVLVPLDLDRHRQLKDGAYAEQYVARARLAGESDKTKPLSMARWVHFIVRDGKVSYVSPIEYSRLVDPPSDALDGAGGKIQVNAGRGAKADVPLERTKSSPAIALGRLGGVPPERETAAPEKNRDEARER
jgi:hypothetical protein